MVDADGVSTAAALLRAHSTHAAHVFPELPGWDRYELVGITDSEE